MFRTLDEKINPAGQGDANEKRLTSKAPYKDYRDDNRQKTMTLEAGGSSITAAS